MTVRLYWVNTSNYVTGLNVFIVHCVRLEKISRGGRLWAQAICPFLSPYGASVICLAYEHILPLLPELYLEWYAGIGPPHREDCGCNHFRFRFSSYCYANYPHRRDLISAICKVLKTFCLVIQLYSEPFNKASADIILYLGLLLIWFILLGTVLLDGLKNQAINS